MTVYHVETQQAYDALMVELEEKGCIWMGGDKLTDFDEFSTHGIDTYIYEECCEIFISSGNYFKAHHSDETLIEYKAKGDKQMLNTECKQCHKKWHHTNAKYCAMCGNKLVDEPKFKVGDIVSSEIFIDGSGIVRLEEDLINDFSGIKGLWYIKKDCEIKDTAFGVVNKKTRHATPEEVTEYKAALNFHKHGRNPFEVKDGDLIEYPTGQNIMIYHPDCFSKTDFLNDGFKLLKTEEEVNEWLENK